ncbi:phosphatidylserine decarboxylase [Laetiporus sulphureus 93-53]|uniref:Phosphatidylserine decarboxylase proenzyme 1, mitochondrial n=1 Tax=Laetiporus sulphureus 93-53 TaxID=1314785 RepID=A0A165FJ53_9APHY|nr:phosphatidylserine decarboxylase [Laetiporus sulphureus 93-53]KZT09048.1 phosphatidylserine decarboxylase [Laetiporus sulphureus 93-53]
MLTHNRSPIAIARASAFRFLHRDRLHERSRRAVEAILKRTGDRPFTSGQKLYEDLKSGPKISLHRRLIDAWTKTPTKWYPLPVAVGALLLVFLQYRKRAAVKEIHIDEHGHEVVYLKGPWHVHVLGALPLRNLSRLWGYLNSLELPVWFRPIGFRLYARIFGCNLNEINPEDLTQYASLGEFFYRKLKDGTRPIADTILVSPADGKVLHFGTIVNGRIEQIKGSTYSLDALLGIERPNLPRAMDVEFPEREMAEVNDRDFAEINGIEYSLDEFLGISTPPTPVASGTATPAESKGGASPSASPHKHAAELYGQRIDASVPSQEPLKDVVAHDASVAAEMGVQPFIERRTSRVRVKPGNALYFAVIYLAPGDYHRFHSPAAWVVEKRRHFIGDLFSVSPWMVKQLENLFVLNERVALLGRWRYGFFSMVPVGATNVGSIKISFDQALRTNVGSRRKLPTGTYTEAVYTGASPILGGQPLTKAQEMGGFCLGSTIVLIFEAPDRFQFAVHAGQRIKVGEPMGDVATEHAEK